MQPNASGAICRERVVELRLLAQFSDRAHVVEEYPPQVFQRAVDSIYVNLFLRVAVCRSHANHITLIRLYVIELVLPKKACQREIRFALLLLSLGWTRRGNLYR